MLSTEKLHSTHIPFVHQNLPVLSSNIPQSTSQHKTGNLFSSVHARHHSQFDRKKVRCVHVILQLKCLVFTYRMYIRIPDYNSK